MCMYYICVCMQANGCALWFINKMNAPSFSVVLVGAAFKIETRTRHARVRAVRVSFRV